MEILPIVRSDQERIECKKVAVVVLGYNSRDYLARFLPSVVATEYEDHTVVYVDNASVDDSVEMVKADFPSIKILRLYQNHGFTSGYAHSLPFIDAEYYVLINSDVRVETDWLGHLMEVIESDDGIGACQPKLLHEPKPSHFDYGGASGGFMDKHGYTFCRGRLFHHVEEDQHQYEDVRDIFWASGACMLVRAELFHQLGGLDNDFYAHMEEIDLCWRIKNNGHRIVVAPASVVYHVGGSIIRYGSFSKIYHNYRNNLIMMLKNLPEGQVFFTLFARMVLDQIAAVRALFSGQWTEWRAIWYAHWQFLSRLGKWRASRRRVRHLVTKPNMAGWFQRSIIYDVFLSGRKTFSELEQKAFK